MQINRHIASINFKQQLNLNKYLRALLYKGYSPVIDKVGKDENPERKVQPDRCIKVNSTEGWVGFATPIIDNLTKWAVEISFDNFTLANDPAYLIGGNSYGLRCSTASLLYRSSTLAYFNFSSVSSSDYLNRKAKILLISDETKVYLKINNNDKGFVTPDSCLMKITRLLMYSAAVASKADGNYYDFKAWDLSAYSADWIQNSFLDANNVPTIAPNKADLGLNEGSGSVAFNKVPGQPHGTYYSDATTVTDNLHSVTLVDENEQNELNKEGFNLACVLGGGSLLSTNKSFGDQVTIEYWYSGHPDMASGVYGLIGRNTSNLEDSRFGIWNVSRNQILYIGRGLGSGSMTFTILVGSATNPVFKKYKWVIDFVAKTVKGYIDDILTLDAVMGYNPVARSAKPFTIGEYQVGTGKAKGVIRDLLITDELGLKIDLPLWNNVDATSKEVWSNSGVSFDCFVPKKLGTSVDIFDKELQFEDTVKYNLTVSGNKFDFAPYRSEDLGENLIVDYDGYENFEYFGSLPGDEATITKIAEKHYRITDDLGAYDWRDKFFGWDLTGKYVNGKTYKVGAWMRGNVSQDVYIRDFFKDSGKTVGIANINTVWKYFEFVWTYIAVIEPDISFGRTGWHLALTNQWFEIKNPFVQEVIDTEISETNFLASMIYNKNACTGNGFGFPEIWNSSILTLENFNPANSYEWDLAELTQANIDNYLNPAYQGRVIVKRYSDTNIKFLITAA